MSEDTIINNILRIIPCGGSLHIYDLARWWESESLGRLWGDPDVFVSRRHDIFTYRAGLVSVARHGVDWSTSLRDDLRASTEGIRHTKMSRTDAAPVATTYVSPKRGLSVSTPTLTALQRAVDRKGPMSPAPVAVSTKTTPTTLPRPPAQKNVDNGLLIATYGGVLASLRMIQNQGDREVLKCALDSSAEIVNDKDAFKALVLEWIDEKYGSQLEKTHPTAPPPPPATPDYEVPYTPHQEYKGVVDLVTSSGGKYELSVGASTVGLGSTGNFIAKGARPFATQKEVSPWVGVQFHELSVKPTHYTLAYHPCSGVLPPLNWCLEGLVDPTTGHGQWQTLSSHEEDASYGPPGNNEVVVSFKLQPATGYYKAFRIRLTPTGAPQTLPVSGFEIYGAVQVDRT